MDGASIVRIEIDKDEDGAIERWEYYDANKRLEKVGTSRANDGKVDTWAYPAADGATARIERSTRRDGRVTRTEFYEGGVLATGAGRHGLQRGRGQVGDLCERRREQRRLRYGGNRLSHPSSCVRCQGRGDSRRERPRPCGRAYRSPDTVEVSQRTLCRRCGGSDAAVYSALPLEPCRDRGGRMRLKRLVALALSVACAAGVQPRVCGWRQPIRRDHFRPHHFRRRAARGWHESRLRAPSPAECRQGHDPGPGGQRPERRVLVTGDGSRSLRGGGGRRGRKRPGSQQCPPVHNHAADHERDPAGETGAADFFSSTAFLLLSAAAGAGVVIWAIDADDGDRRARNAECDARQ